MGSGLPKERVSVAVATGILSCSRCGIRSWRDVVAGMETMKCLRSVALDGNKLRKPVPPAFMRLQLWSSLRTLDLSSNGLTCACVMGRLGACTRSATGVHHYSDTRVTYPLESLNLSGNSLHQLPPLLLCLFPKLRRLICRGNNLRLTIDGGLARCIGPGAALATVDLGSSGIQKFCLNDVADGEMEPYPSLRELLLDGNHIGGVFTLVSMQVAPQTLQAVLPQMRTLNIASQHGVLERIDPSVYAVAPSLNAIDVSGNARQTSIMEELRESDEYKQWCERHKSAVDRQLLCNGDVTLM
ncbi:leucine richcontaining 57 [Trypanosoma grayi]|uniref:leucine richcontaining 57 n=1 Tax=Trypanosoma grayi TaxID=71804 RepID=UPI0004F4ADBD|nr:leucine richcontaining 57 [Trypanosoma grayi]KEG12322.1 leucine richcontaining 57 [Trypanosoma grayi]